MDETAQECEQAEQSARTVLHDQGEVDEEIAGSNYGEPDRERSSERDDEEPPPE